MIQVNVKFFARLREQLGCAELNIQLKSPASLTHLKAQLAARDEDYRQAFADESLLCAVNHQHCSGDSALSDGDEIAFFPPVTGG